MTLLSFIQQKAQEKGIKTCPNCGKQDIFYALDGRCLECTNPMPRNSTEKSLQFALELITEFVERYDECNSMEDKKIPLQFFKGLIHNLSNNTMPENDKIIRLQSFIKNMGGIGGNRIGGLILMENGKPSLQITENYQRMENEPPLARIKSLSAIILAIQYISELKVKNEFVLGNTSSKINTETSQNTVTNKSNNSGCFGLIILFAASFLTIVLLISIL